MAALYVPGGQGVGAEAPGRQKDPAGQLRGAAVAPPGGQKVPAAQAAPGAPLEQSIPGGQGTQCRARMR